MFSFSRHQSVNLPPLGRPTPRATNAVISGQRDTTKQVHGCGGQQQKFQSDSQFQGGTQFQSNSQFQSAHGDSRYQGGPPAQQFGTGFTNRNVQRNEGGKNIFTLPHNQPVDLPPSVPEGQKN